MNEIIINDEKEFESVVKEGVCLVDFFAKWCAPCKLLSPIIEEVAEKYANKVKVCKVNVDDVESLAYKYNIMSIPALLYFKDGVLKDHSVGFQDMDSIESVLKKYL